MEMAIPVVMMFAPGNKTARMPYSVDGTAAVRSGELYLSDGARRKYSATSTLALGGDVCRTVCSGFGPLATTRSGGAVLSACAPWTEATERCAAAVLR